VREGAGCGRWDGYRRGWVGEASRNGAKIAEHSVTLTLINRRKFSALITGILEKYDVPISDYTQLFTVKNNGTELSERSAAEIITVNGTISFFTREFQ